MADGLGLVQGFISGRQQRTGLQAQEQEQEQRKQLFAQQQQRANIGLVGERDTARLNSIVQGAQQLKQISDPQQKISFLNARRQQLIDAGLGTQDTDEAIALAQQGRFEELEAITDQAINFGQQFAGQTGLSRVQSAEDLPGGLTKIITRQGDIQIKDAAGNLIEGDAAIDAVIKAEERKAELAQRVAQGKAVGTTTGKRVTGRVQEAIDKGIDASAGFANLERALELLGRVKTGGIDRVNLAAKQLFGIEGADEAELSNRLGKAVLSQLRQTFGAAFTAQEGQQLQVIEANYGKSTVGNRRLLTQAKALVVRAARRGIDAAVDSGDFRAAADIQEALDFRFSDEGGFFTTPQPEGAGQVPAQAAPAVQTGAQAAPAQAAPPQIEFLGFE